MSSALRICRFNHSYYGFNTSYDKCRRWRNSTVSGAFASILDTILRALRCQCKEVLSLLTSSRKEVISFLTSYCKDVLVPCRIQEQANARSPKKLLTCRGKVSSYNTHANVQLIWSKKQKQPKLSLIPFFH